MAKTALTMVTKVTETKRATNIYLTNQVAIALALRLIREAENDSGVRIVILNKETLPDVQVYPYAVDRIRLRKRRKKP